MSVRNVKASRLDVLRLLVTFEETHYGNYADFSGTKEELVSAGLVESGWLAESEFGVSGQCTRNDQYNNQIVIKRRGKGIFHLHIRLGCEDSLDFNDRKIRKLAWFREHGAQFDVTVADVIARISRPREAQS